MKKFGSMVLFSCFAAAAVAMKTPVENAMTEKPNVALNYADDFGWGNLHLIECLFIAECAQN